MDKTYDPKKVETQIYSLWEKGGYFTPRVGKKKKPFTIIMPPPNANGSLHIGHALFVTLEDLMARYHRMLGEPTLWLPGADHAGFETQVVFDKKLEKEGRDRFQIPREDLFGMMWEFTQENKKTMNKQLRKLAASCDWSREKFTLDEDIVSLVCGNFKKLYEDGLAYRDFKPVNWCTKHQTSLSELEVKYLERKDPLYYIKYGPLTLATVRPETKFGDTAVAVHPKDKRYKKYVGQEIEITTVLGKAKIKVVADRAVDPKFGTGAVKITPAHDPNDFEMAKRHDLEIKEVIDAFGKMNEKAGPYKGLKVLEAREKVVRDMKKKGLLDHIDKNYKHTIGVCYKCQTVIEPKILPQWFIKMNGKGVKTKKSMSEMGIKAASRGEVEFIPGNFKKIYLHWLNNLRDWNISRQIIWGIQIPVWYCLDCNPKDKKNNTLLFGINAEPIISEKKPHECPKCKAKNLVQETDVFDTWFSSGQWPFATLQTTKPGDFDYFYPTQVMETGHDILFFWVARMIMLGLYFTDKKPFKTVYLHGLIRDKDRQKMSKSKGNVIDPLAVAEVYGTDAVRFALIYNNAAGNDPVISEDKIRGMRNFTNKIWNASRFILSQETKGEFKTPKHPDDKWIVGELEKASKTATDQIEKYHFGQAAETLYLFFWRVFCDQYLEMSKKRREDTQPTLVYVLENSLKLLHPFMPFITEEIYQKLPIHGESIMIEEWPKKGGKY